MWLLHEIWKKYLPGMYRYLGETRKMLLVTESEYARVLVHDVKKMRDFRYELVGITVVEGDFWIQEIDGVKVAAEDADTVWEFLYSNLCKPVCADGTISLKTFA